MAESRTEIEDPRAVGIADIDDAGTVTQLIEKSNDPPTNLARIGMYVCSPAVFDAIQSLFEDGHAIDSHVVTGWLKYTGKPEDILEANRLVFENAALETAGTVEDGAETTGWIALHVSSKY